MSGGVSHIDTFQYKPALQKYNRMPMDGHGEIKVRQGYPGPLMQSPFSFKQYGQSGAWVSEIFPNIATMVDDLAFVHSCQGTSNDHVISHYEWNTGSIQMGYPSVGAWVTYGLGQREPEPAGFRGDARSEGRSLCRSAELAVGIPAGGVSRHGVPLQGRLRFSDLSRARAVT